LPWVARESDRRARAHPHRWRILGIVCLCVIVIVITIVLDDTILNVALPSRARRQPPTFACT
jgi:hypothetical protein